MKKIIKSIIAFFFRKKDNQTVHPQRDAYLKLPTGTYYCVYLDQKWLGYYENLFQVSKKYPILKKSTLYNAFKGDEPRTYQREDYYVVKTIKL